MRPKHYIKNFLIFFPLFFSGNLLKNQILSKSLVGFLIFCAFASCVYIINDIVDVDKDRAHSTKRFRPIASGAVSIQGALILVFLLVISSLVLTFFILKNISLILIPFSYFVLNLMYSFKLKNIPLVDVFTISLGFLLRLFYGGEIISVSISNWLYLTVLFGTLFLGFGKRRNELVREVGETRKSLKKYNVNFLESAFPICIAATIVFYSLWTIETDQTGFLTKITVPLVTFVAFQYYMGIWEGNSGDPTEILYKNRWVQLVALILVVVIGWRIYLG